MKKARSFTRVMALQWGDNGYIFAFEPRYCERCHGIYDAVDDLRVNKEDDLCSECQNMPEPKTQHLECRFIFNRRSYQSCSV